MAARPLSSTSPALSRSLQRQSTTGAWALSESFSCARHDDVRHVLWLAAMQVHRGFGCPHSVHVSLEFLDPGGYVALGGAGAQPLAAYHGKYAVDHLAFDPQLDASWPALFPCDALGQRLPSSCSHCLECACLVYLCGSSKPPSQELQNDVRFVYGRTVVRVLCVRRRGERKSREHSKAAIVLSERVHLYQECRTPVFLRTLNDLFTRERGGKASGEGWGRGMILSPPDEVLCIAIGRRHTTK